ncbi:hypothetical protein [Bradyrhizobium ottawaense]|uniref:hypothetical protein n=1 Tax=Bradyrhizobium ottawaense TaxID=931866 RepID=UPI003F9FE3A9
MDMTHVESRLYSQAASIIFVGRNSHGNWIARERNGLFGGIFVNRAQALKYAIRENGRLHDGVIEVSCQIELNIPPTTNGARRGSTREADAVERANAVLCR